MTKIRLGLFGYGHLSAGIQYAVDACDDMQMVAAFTRRNPKDVHPVLPLAVYASDSVAEFKDQIDVMILCGGSATDLPKQGPKLLQHFHTVDSFDTHAEIPAYFDKMNKVGSDCKHLAAISIGWDPGLFSLARTLFSAVTPIGENYTFWGKGVSQGHSDAIRRIAGVDNAVQYTVPKIAAINAVRNGEMPNLTTKQKHSRVCFVVAKVGADCAQIEQEIKHMPYYFSDYDTEVHFISNEQMLSEHNQMPHGGSVLRSAKSHNQNQFQMELSLQLQSNPEFTAGVLVAYARAVDRLAKQGKTGAVTVLDIPIAYLSPLDSLHVMKQWL